MLYVASVTPVTRTPSQFLDRSPFMIPALLPVSFPRRIRQVVDDIFVPVLLQAILNCSTSTLPPLRWIMSQLFLWSSQTVKKLFYPTNSSTARSPSLCRVYFGKVVSEVDKGGRPNGIFNSANFHLDVDGYQMIKRLSFGMGEMLGHLHWRAGYGAHDPTGFKHEYMSSHGG
jgi:hypothetical protein